MEPSIFVSIVAASVAIVSGYCAYATFRRSSCPEVIFYAEAATPTKEGLVNLVVENIGNGCARDVKFSFSFDLLENVFIGGPHGDLPYKALKSGIPFLRPGGKRVFVWGSYGELCEYFGQESEESVTVSFKTNSSLPRLLRRGFSKKYPIEIKSLYNVSSL